MAQQIKLEIIIDGSLNVFPFASLTINQLLGEHHNFELCFSHDLIEGNDEITIVKYQKFLGKMISFTFGADMYDISKNHKDVVYKGIITEICMSENPFDEGNIIIKGNSPTILLETVENCSAHLNKNLAQIVQTVSKSIPGNLLTVNANPINKKTIPYLVQYKESTYDFLKRLAADYGEWLIYTGKELFFGKPNNLPEVELKFPEDVSAINFSVSLAPLTFSQTSYSLKKAKDEFVSKSKSATINGLGNFASKALKTSEETFQIESNAPSFRSLDKDNLEDSIKIKKGNIAATLAVVTAESDNPGVHVGTIVNITKNKASLGKFLVIQVMHTTDGNGNYTNSFKGIPADVDYLPAPNFSRPYIESQIGTVIDNKDPDGQGRVKVHLLWYSDNDKSAAPWIQVMTDYAGDAGRGKNRGNHFIPEIGDSVVVSFTENDPSKPFVMGSISVQDKRDTKSNDKNFEKVIATRSGNTIFFRDKEDSKEQEIRIETDTNNIISILVKNGKGAIEIKSSEKIEVSSDKSILVKSEDIKVEGKTISINATDSIEMKANKDISISATNVKINGKAKVEVASTQVSIKADATAEVKANAQLTLQASGQAVLKGAIVMIN